MSEDTTEAVNPWEQLFLAVDTQLGPDNKTHMVSVHVGTPALSAAFVFPADQADMIADQLSNEIKMKGRNARIKNSRLSIIQNGKFN